MERRQRVAVYGVCEDGDGRVLLVRAARTLTVAGHWFLPGGGLEHGEDPEAGLRREFLEETGLTVGAATLRQVLADTATWPDGASLHTVRIVYGVTSWEGVLQAEASGSTDAVRWVPRDDLAGLPLMPYVTAVLADVPNIDRP